MQNLSSFIGMKYIIALAIHVWSYLLPEFFYQLTVLFVIMNIYSNIIGRNLLDIIYQVNTCSSCILLTALYLKTKSKPMAWKYLFESFPYFLLCAIFTLISEAAYCIILNQLLLVYHHLYDKVYIGSFHLFKFFS